MFFSVRGKFFGLHFFYFFVVFAKRQTELSPAGIVKVISKDLVQREAHGACDVVHSLCQPHQILGQGLYT